jgi:hypothetical protein
MEQLLSQTNLQFRKAKTDLLRRVHPSENKTAMKRSTTTICQTPSLLNRSRPKSIEISMKIEISTKINKL